MKKTTLALSLLLAAACATSVSAATFTDFDSYTSFEGGGNPVYALDADIMDYFAGEWAGEGGNGDNLTTEIADGAGFNGTKALKIASDGTENAAVILFATEGNGIATSYEGAKYLRVWADFSDVEFRKANFGVTSASYTLFTTDEVDGEWDAPFYYSPDGKTWTTMEHGGDGCFGTAQDTPMLGLKGWFAFPVSDFAVRADVNWDAVEDFAPCNPEDINGVYFYWDYTDGSYVNTAFYLDNMEFVADYTAFDYALPEVDPDSIVLPPTIADKISAAVTECTEGVNEQSAHYLFDFDKGTDWVVNGNTASVVWNYTIPLNATGYSIATASNAAENAGANPTAWTVSGSNDGQNWTVLASVTGDTTLTAESSTKLEYTIDTPAEYTWFKLEITANGGADTTAISQFDISCDGYFVMNKEQYAVGEDITFTAVGTGEWDWIAIYPDDGTEPGTNGGSLCYYYIYECKGAPWTWKLGNNLPAGNYRAQYLLNDGYEYTQTVKFTIVEGDAPAAETPAETEAPAVETEAPAPETLMSVEKTEFAYGEDIMVTAHSTGAKDWVGIYSAEGTLPGGGDVSDQWFYANISEGTPINLKDHDGPMGGQSLEPGKYILYFLFNDGYEIGHSIEITVKEQQAETEAAVVETEVPETEAEVVETEAEPTEEPEAPQTFDFGVIGALAAIVSLAAAGVSRKRR